MKTIAVIVRASQEPRVAEALRAAVGLTLRGDQVVVALCSATEVRSPRIDRAVATLRELGHHVLAADPYQACRRADAVEVWT